jgi:hypothetical protein
MRHETLHLDSCRSTDRRRLLPRFEDTGCSLGNSAHRDSVIRDSVLEVHCPIRFGHGSRQLFGHGTDCTAEGNRFFRRAHFHQALGQLADYQQRSLRQLLRILQHRGHCHRFGFHRDRRPAQWAMDLSGRDSGSATGRRSPDRGDLFRRRIAADGDRCPRLSPRVGWRGRLHVDLGGDATELTDSDSR